MMDRSDGDAWSTLQTADPAFVQSIHEFERATTQPRALSPKEACLVLIGAAAAVTTSDFGQVRAQSLRAFDCGASLEEVTEVLHVVSVLGSHAHIISVPLLQALVPDAAARELTPAEAALKERFIAEWGFWSDIWQAMLVLDPEYFELSRFPWRRAVLPPRLIELIYVAIDASSTHLYSRGTSLHMGSALAAGATPEEIADVLRLVGGQGLRSVLDGLPMVMDAHAEYSRGSADTSAVDLTPDRVRAEN